ncbi:hypothetical protein [Sphingomonas sp. AX6]|uniref:hypothetical protein n=1 Tax=Sphingomonas sp. AX6 TaxID=2653171 RepID=UPI0012F3BF94|nr:hypothetical protein [Sphingomonas sp. AX6]VXC40079.1 conserved membrane hypothetical protein [Sphingomonas sp. AX6]
MNRTPAAQRYLRRFTVVTAAYVLLIAANVGVSWAFDPSQTILGLMAIVAALPIVGMLIVLGIYLREESDEFVRDRIVLSMLIGLGVLLSLSSILGMLQFEGLVGELPVFLAFPIWCGAWGIAQSLLALRDKRADAA